MTKPSEALRHRLEEKRLERETLRQRIVVLEAEIGAFEEAIRLLQGPASGEAAKNSHEADDRQSSAVPTRSTSGRRRRSLQPHWKAVLGAISRSYPQVWTLDEIIEFAEREGHEVERNTLRSQTSLYTSRGLLERIAPGQYRGTEAGADAADVELGSDSQKQIPPDDSSSGGSGGGVAERSNAPGSKPGGGKAVQGYPSPVGSNPTTSSSVSRQLLSGTALPTHYLGGSR